MRTRKLLFFVGLLFYFSMAFAQQNRSEVISAFKEGRSKELGKCMSNAINLVILNAQIDTDKPKAIAIMDDFFTKNKVSGFDLIHEGQRDESGFIIGLLITTKGKYRVNCFLKKENENYLIHQIRIDKANE